MSFERSAGQDMLPLSDIKSFELGDVRPFFSSEFAGPEMLRMIRDHIDFSLYFGYHSYEERDKQRALSFVRSLNPRRTILLIEQYGFDPANWDGERLVLPLPGERNAFEEAAFAAWEAGISVKPADFDSWDREHWETYQELAGPEDAPDATDPFSSITDFWKYPFEDIVATCGSLQEKAKLEMKYSERKKPILQRGLHSKARSDAAIKDMLLVAGYFASCIRGGALSKDPRLTIALMRGVNHMDILTEHMRDLGLPYKMLTDSFATPHAEFFTNFILHESGLKFSNISYKTIALPVPIMRNIYELYRREFAQRIPADWDTKSKADQLRINQEISNQLRSYLNELLLYFSDKNLA